jgi:hypothetical protein
LGTYKQPATPPKDSREKETPKASTANSKAKEMPKTAKNDSQGNKEGHDSFDDLEEINLTTSNRG